MPQKSVEFERPSLCDGGLDDLGSSSVEVRPYAKAQVAAQLKAKDLSSVGVARQPLRCLGIALAALTVVFAFTGGKDGVGMALLWFSNPNCVRPYARRLHDRLQPKK